jgi:spermidine synthase
MLNRFWFIFTLFFISGACGLIYQVVWSRMMSLIFGRSILAVGIVLAAFMAGLAIGSYVLGNISDKNRNPLRLYAIYEIGIGLTALIASYALMNISPVYVAIHGTITQHPLILSALRFFLAFSILIVPTLLMGATLPILSRVVIRRLTKVGHELGRLYAINTIGAVAGCLAAGFLLIKLFGLHGTIYIAVIANLGVGVIAWIASRNVALKVSIDKESTDKLPFSERHRSDQPGTARQRLLLGAFALSGLTSFSYEIFWTRSLVFLLGNTTYAFTLMLTAFLTGIALGGFTIRYVADRVKNRLNLFAALQVLIGLFSAASLPLLFSILGSESIHSMLQRMSGKFGLLVLSESFIALLLMLLPATLIGATLPLIGRIFVTDLHNTGKTVGKVYAVNTVGNVVGALLPGLLILPLLGIQKGILLMAALNICLGIAVMLSQWRRTVIAAFATTLLFVAATIILIYMPVSFRFPSESQTDKDATLFYREGGLVTTKTWIGTNSGNKMISVDGVNIGGTNDTDYKQQILAHLPKLLLKSYRSELSIGLGSGILIGESGRHKQIKRIVCVEISPGVIEGARFFKKENHNVLNDLRVDIVLDDVGHYLQTSEEKFDIISADGKTAEKYSTNAFSYSKDYYSFLKKRMAPNGLVIQWIPTALPESQYNLVLRTFLDSYPHVSLWTFAPVNRFFMANTILVGSNEPIEIDPEWIQQELDSNSKSYTGIKKYGLNSAEDILSHYVADGKTLRKTIPPGPINSFVHPHYEFYSPGDYAESSRSRVKKNHARLQAIRGPDFEQHILKYVSASHKTRMLKAYKAEEFFLKGYEKQLENAHYTTVLQYYEKAIQSAPRSRSLRNQIAAYLVEQFRAYYGKKDYTNALAYLHLTIQINPESAIAHEDYGMMLRRTKQPDAAVPELQHALRLDPELVFARRVLGEIYVENGLTEEALELWQEALILEPNDVKTLTLTGIHLARQGVFPEAQQLMRKAYQLARKNPDVINGYAEVMYLSGDISTARKVVQEGQKNLKENPSFKTLRAKILN